MYSLVRQWPGDTVVCLAGGPSLTAGDVDFCRGKARVVAVNDAYRLAPWADVLYACDFKWWEHHQGVPLFAGLKLTLEAKAERWDGVKALRRAGPDGLELDPAEGITTGGSGSNSGFQAINVAVQLGASRVVLLGYDMQLGPKGRSHWFGKHPRGLQKDACFSSFRSAFNSMVKPLRQAGVEVLNCSRETALTAFPRAALADVLVGVAA